MGEPEYAEVSANAIAPLQLLLEVAIFPELSTDKARNLPPISRDEMLDAISHRALPWHQIVWEWAADQGQIPIADLVQPFGQLGDAPVTLDLIYTAMAEIDELYGLEFSFPLRPSGFLGPVPADSPFIHNKNPKVMNRDGMRLHMVDRTDWLRYDFRTSKGLVADEAKKDIPEELLKQIPIFGRPSLRLGECYVGEVWARISEAGYKHLMGDKLNAIEVLALSTNARLSHMRDNIHEQQPDLTGEQQEILNRYFRFYDWANLLLQKITEIKTSKLLPEDKAADVFISAFHDTFEQFTGKDETVAKTNSNVFISYSHADEKWKDKLLTMLSPLIRGEVLTVWHDRKIKPSQDWRGEIDKAMGNAGIALMLVSKHFLSSDFINDKELPFFIDAAKKRGVKILWVCLSHCLYKHTPLTHLQAVNEPEHPLASFRGASQDKQLVKICEAIKEASAAE